MGKKTALAEKDEQLNRFLKKIDQMKAQLQKYAVFLSTLDGAAQLTELKVRLQKIEPLLSEFEEITLEIKLLDEARISELIVDEFESLYYKCVSTSREVLDTFETGNSSQPNLGVQPQHNMSTASVQLPRLGVPKFGGDYGKFPQFFETFETLIHKNTGVDNIQKFYYLLDSLEGEAKRVLECLEITNDNYSVAIELLKKRFYNKPIIIQSHLKALFDMASINKESHQLLQGMVDSIEKHVRALKALGEPVDKWDSLLIFFLTRKLDLDTKKEWEEKAIDNFSGNPSFREFINFLQNKARVLGTVEYNNKSSRNLTKQVVGNRGSYAVVGHDSSNSSHNSNTVKCEYCKGAHYVYFCETLLAFPVEKRAEQVRNLKLCFNCLRSSHQVKDCRSSGCKKCKRRHNTILHLDSSATVEDKNNCHSATIASTENLDSDGQVVAAACSSTIQPAKQIVLSTACVEIKAANGNFVKGRALLDSGSQVNFVSEDLAKQLGLKFNRTSVPISGISEVVTNINFQINSKIKSVYNNYTADLSFLVLKNITANIPSCSFDSVDFKIPANIKLADPHFNRSAKINILLGAGIFFDLLCAGQIKLGKQLPVSQKTVLGWVVSGPLYINSQNQQSLNSNRVHCHLAYETIESQLEKFWALEEYPIVKRFSIQEQECENHFLENVTRDETGRFGVRLPLKSNVKSLGESLIQAKNRLFSLEKKLSKNPLLKKNYCEFMNEYVSLGHMSRIPENEIDSSNQIFYLPHHAVVNEASLTTKVRVVFDASAKSSSGISLNDVLMIGPTIQDELFEILIRFRQFNVVIIADIAKMYRQVNVAPEHRDLQRIIWRRDPSLEIEHFRLNTVTYGTASASFLATRCIKQISNDIKEKSPELSDVINKYFYVDDWIYTTSTVETAIDVGQNLSQCLAEYGFPLRKWCSNKDEVLRALSDENDNMTNHFTTDNDKRKTLGIFWRAKNDTLEYSIKASESNFGTRRFILSVISQIFDPLGLVGPVTIKAKIILQRLWKLQIGWDESIPLDLLTVWNSFYNQLKSLTSITIPRQCLISDSNFVEVHGFCDSSESAYGACLYLRSVNSATGNGLVKLLCAKSRVAPLHFTSLPRLELCGALVLARLTKKVVDALDIKIDRIFLWTDSTIVLAWLADEPCNLKIFVANRVEEIQNLSKLEQWNHVMSSDNPADIISRGLNPSQLQDSNLWWLGPVWLSQHQDYWPKHNIEKIQDIPERKKEKITLLNVIPDQKIFTVKNSLFKLTRVVAWCLRFYRNVTNKCDIREYSKSLTITEIDNALICLVKIAQAQEFAMDLRSLKERGCVSKHSKLKSLDPFYHEGLILVGGRLRKSLEAFSTKHPIILPQKHPLTRLIILDKHQKHLHAGAQAILSPLRDRFWIINGRKIVRSVLSKCRTCFRVKPSTMNQKMGDLPKDRVTPQRPFYICGIDYAGPFNLKDGKLRNRAIVKGYMCMFVCFVTKAVHIELASDLSTDAFLNCLKRFVSRRGLCKRIYSDNATNFVGANNELKRVNEFLPNIQKDKTVETYLLENKIEWQFIPAKSPHQGGLWESAIKSAKHHLIRIVGNRNLTFEELSTVFSQIEAVLNSRPLAPLSSDPNDLQALTPGHFLIGAPLAALPQQDVVDTPSNRLRQYHLLQQIVQNLWRRWSAEYMTQLQQRKKWQSSSPNLEVGSMVILKEENSHPLSWRLGRVVEVHPDCNGEVRTASVKTISGVFKRAIQRLCLLPMENDSSGSSGSATKPV